MESYYDNTGRRIRLDTRHLVWCSEEAAEMARRRQEAEELERRGRRLSNILRLIICVPCGWFAIANVRIIYLHPIEAITGIGVVASLAFIGTSIRAFWGEEER